VRERGEEEEEEEEEEEDKQNVSSKGHKTSVLNKLYYDLLLTNRSGSGESVFIIQYRNLFHHAQVYYEFNSESSATLL